MPLQLASSMSFEMISWPRKEMVQAFTHDQKAIILIVAIIVIVSIVLIVIVDTNTPRNCLKHLKPENNP